MQIRRLHPKLHTLSKLIKPEENLTDEEKELKKKLVGCADMLAHKMPWSKIQEHMYISKAHYYRLKKRVELHGLKGAIKRSKRPKRLREKTVVNAILDEVLLVRLENPTYSKAKIGAILRRDHGVLISDSSVGRALSILIKRGKIKVSACAAKAKRRRKFNKHAQRWQYGMKPVKPGDIVQIDHMTVSKNNICFKHFKAWDAVSRFVYADVTTNATAISARTFLRNFLKYAPFQVRAIQVDGGSEFMAQFEDECHKLGITLYVLPPRRPQYNGGVERANRTFREEFYLHPQADKTSIGAIKIALHKYLHKYNNYRPHHALKSLTPMQYIAKLETIAIQSKSHIL
jgi:transposase